jgi:hypothetical protein
MKNLYILIIALFVFACNAPLPPEPTEVLGPEKVFNGTFDNNTWLPAPGDISLIEDSTWYSNKITETLDENYDGWTIDSGVGKHVTTNHPGTGLFQLIDLDSNRTYKVTFDVVKFIPLMVDGSVPPVGTTSTFIFVGDFQYKITINQAVSYTRYINVGSLTLPVNLLMLDSSDDFMIDNLSIKEVL